MNVNILCIGKIIEEKTHLKNQHIVAEFIKKIKLFCPGVVIFVQAYIIVNVGIIL